MKALTGSCPRVKRFVSLVFLFVLSVSIKVSLSVIQTTNVDKVIYLTRGKVHLATAASRRVCAALLPLSCICIALPATHELTCSEGS